MEDVLLIWREHSRSSILKELEISSSLKLAVPSAPCLLPHHGSAHTLLQGGPRGSAWPKATEDKAYPIQHISRVGTSDSLRQCFSNLGSLKICGPQPPESLSQHGFFGVEIHTSAICSLLFWLPHWLFGETSREDWKLWSHHHEYHNHR